MTSHMVRLIHTKLQSSASANVSSGAAAAGSSPTAAAGGGGGGSNNAANNALADGLGSGRVKHMLKSKLRQARSNATKKGRTDRGT